MGVSYERGTPVGTATAVRREGYLQMTLSVELIPTLRALSPRGGPVQDPVLTHTLPLQVALPLSDAKGYLQMTLSGHKQLLRERGGACSLPEVWGGHSMSFSWELRTLNPKFQTPGGATALRRERVPANDARGAGLLPCFWLHPTPGLLFFFHTLKPRVE